MYVCVYLKMYRYEHRQEMKMGVLKYSVCVEHSTPFPPS